MRRCAITRRAVLEGSTSKVKKITRTGTTPGLGRGEPSRERYTGADSSFLITTTAPPAEEWGGAAVAKLQWAERYRGSDQSNEVVDLFGDLVRGPRSAAQQRLPSS